MTIFLRSIDLGARNGNNEGMSNTKQVKPPKRPRVPVSQSDIEQHLERQLYLLEKSCSAFDEGDVDEYGRIATAIRVMVYDQNQSRSVLGQLGMKTIDFVSYAKPIDGRNFLADSPLTLTRMSVGGARILPILDTLGNAPRCLKFQEWWSETIIRLPDDTRLSRSDVVLIAANQAGGAHVDPDLDEAFHRIANLNEAGGFFSISGGQPVEVADLEKAVVRQVGFELIQTVQAELRKRVGNNGCACGSGRKHRYCCGKKAK